METNNITGKKSTIYWGGLLNKTNKIFMVICIGMLFTVDLAILISQPELAPFWFIMIGCTVLFGFFYVLENVYFSNKFAGTQSDLDAWIYLLVFLRNIVFVLCVIPLIQILGGLALVAGGLPYLLVYVILITKRFGVVKTDQ